MRKRVYLDNAASSPLDKDVIRLLRRYKKIQGNPSSLHQEGRIARNQIEKARVQCANALGCSPHEIFFTSGASEANSWAQQIWQLKTDIKTHDSLKSPHRKGIPAVSFYNNETGAYDYKRYEDAPEIFVDLTSAVGHTHIDLKSCKNIVGASLSGHKFGALQGVGVLYVRSDQQAKMTSLIMGHQEEGLRGGTENTLGIISLGIAITNSTKNIFYDYIKMHNNIAMIFNSVKDMGLEVQSNNHIINITFKHLSAQTAVTIFDSFGIAISAGSACNSDDDMPSEILLEEGYSIGEALKTIRVSLGHQTTKRECKKFIKTLKKVIDIYDQPVL